MNILLNFFPVSAGGGQQVASNFLKIITQNNYGHCWFVYVGKNSELHKQVEQLLPVKQILAIPYSYKARIFNRGLLKKYIAKNKIELIYNYAPIIPVKGIPQVVRSVYSNLYFPEINFWGTYPFRTRIKKKIIDYFRLRGTLKADGLIFENRSMQDRAESLFKYDRTKTLYVEPSITQFDESNNNENLDYLEEIEDFKILYLSSWHLNKNIHILPYVAKILSEKKIIVKFVLSLDRKNQQIKELLLNPIIENRVENYFELIGKVESGYVHQVVKSSDALILLSKLECFSSNIIEAYSFRKVLFIADEPWSRAVCEDAGIFVDRVSPMDIAEKIIQLVKDKALYDSFVDKAQLSLRYFNTPEEKVRKQVEFLEGIYNKYTT
ncbi:MAG: glycosyltransferase [Bacteroidales bacterium]|nr:glycosyltransferase [Bacteroidales bacterium]